MIDLDLINKGLKYDELLEEYKNLCKFATDYENKNAELVAELKWVQYGIQHFTNEEDRYQQVHLTIHIDRAIAKYGGDK